MSTSLRKLFWLPTVAFVLVLLTGGITFAHAQQSFLGPTPYLRFAAHSPFADLSFSYFQLEDFEDALLNTEGVSATCGAPTCGVTSVVFGPAIHDSVDEDDGVVDGSGLDGDSFFASVGALGVTFSFDASVLGSLPTHVGIVWTDGPTTTTVTLQAFGPGGTPLGTISGSGFADSNHSGGTAEDRFFGVINPDGISAITIDNSNSGGIELDHLQYGMSNQAPDCSNAAPSPSGLWPPNHKFVSITITGVTDPDGDPISINIDSIFQDELVDGEGDGNTTPDGQGVGTDTAEVRAERSGHGNGRVYEIVFTADAGNGGTCTGSVLVGVPHDKKATAVNDGTVVDSTVP